MPLILARALNTLPLQPNVSEASNQYSEYTRDPNTVALHPNVLEAKIIHMALNTVDPNPKGASRDFYRCCSKQTNCRRALLVKTMR